MPSNREDEPLMEFSEICLQARDIERRPLAIKQKAQSETLDLSDDSAIFPKEFESYTFAYALSEAQKVERKLFSSSYKSALNAPPAAQQQEKEAAQPIDEKKMESELHKFASSQEPSLPPEKIYEPKRPGGLKIGPFAIPKLQFGKKKAGEPIVQPEPDEVPLRRQGSLPADIQLAAETEASFQDRQQEEGQSALSKQAPLPQAKLSEAPAFSLSLSPKKIPVPHELPVMAPLPPPKPEEDEEPAGMAEKGRDLEFGGEEIKPPKPREAAKAIGEGELEFGKEQAEGKASELGIQPSVDADAEGPPSKEKPRAASESKISPRLRDIIEARLKKEEEEAKGGKGKQQAIAPGEEEGLQIQGPSEPEQKEEEIILSARERVLRRRAREKKEGPEEAPPAPEEEASPEEELLEERPEQALEEEESPSAKPKATLDRAETQAQEEESELASEPEVEKEEAEEKKQVSKEEIPAKGRRMKPMGEGADLKLSAAPGGLLIRPIFAGEGEEELPKMEKKEAAKGEQVEEARLKRIQRIIGELSPDKYKAGGIPKRVAEEVEESPIEPEKPKEKKGKAVVKQAKKEEKKAAKKGKGEVETVKPDWGSETKKVKATREAIEIAERGRAGGKKAAKGGKGAAGIEGRKGAGGKKAAKGGKGAVEIEAPEEKKEKPFSKGKAKITDNIPKVMLKGGKEKPAAQEKAPQEEEALGGDEPAEKGEEGAAPILSARERLMKVIEEKERKSPEPLDEEAQEPGPKGQPEIKTRILPGGVFVQQKGSIRTYIPPSRQRLIPNVRALRKGEETGEVPAALTRQPARGAKAEMPSVASPGMLRKVGPEKESEEQQRIISRPREVRKALPEKVEEIPAPAIEESHEVDVPRPLQQKRDLAGETKLPQEDELEVPKPPEEDKETPEPAQYREAKDEFRHKMEEEQVKEHAQEESDEMLEAYAKENLVWLYEIYKMGGISREDFLQKAREKLSEEGPAKQDTAPANPALANIGKEIEGKKGKK